jgi:hypothetical protein
MKFNFQLSTCFVLGSKMINTKLEYSLFMTHKIIYKLALAISFTLPNWEIMFIQMAQGRLRLLIIGHNQYKSFQ